MCIKREIAERHPWVVLNLMKAFERANDIAEAARLVHVEYHIDVGLLLVELRTALARTVVRHGIVANRHVLETAAQHAWEQGLLEKKIDRIDDLFAPETHAGVLDLPP